MSESSLPMVPACVERLGDYWSVRYRGAVVICEETYEVCMGVSAMLNGHQPIDGELGEVADWIKFCHD